MAPFPCRVTWMGTKWRHPQRRTSNMSVDVNYIGMDVHKEAIAIAVMNEARKV